MICRYRLYHNSSKWQFSITKNMILLEYYQDYLFLLLVVLLNVYSVGWQRTPLWCQEMWKERLNISSSLQRYSMCLHSCTRQIQTSITDSQGKKSLNENYLRIKNNNLFRYRVFQEMCTFICVTCITTSFLIFD